MYLSRLPAHTRGSLFSCPTSIASLTTFRVLKSWVYEIPKEYVFKMTLDSSVIHILLVGPPASAKTMFLTSLMHDVKDTYYLFTNNTRYLLVDEIDKMSPKDQTFLLNLMETGIVTETKYGKTRTKHIQISVFATSNDVRRISVPLQSRFFIVKLEAYTYEQLCEITKQVLLRHNVDGGHASVIAGAVWNNSRDIRDCVKIGKLVRSEEDLGFLVNMLEGYSEGVTKQN